MKTKLIYLLLALLVQGAVLGGNMPDSVVPPQIKDAIAIGKDTPYLKGMRQMMETVPADKAHRDVKRIAPDFRNKYLQDDEFNYERKEDGVSFWKSFKNAILKLLRGLLGLSPSVSPNFVPILMKVLSGLILLVVIYFAVRIFLNHQGKWFLEKKNDSLDVNALDVEQLIQSGDFAILIADAEKDNNTRLSIRYYYLWLLKKLKDSGSIQWLPDKTNSDYLYEIKNEKLKNQFSHLSYLYEYIWYGQFAINDNEYQEAKIAFDNFLGKGVRRG
jgi:hypothetical protein